MYACLHALAVVADTNETFTGDLTFRFLEDGDSENVIREVNVSSSVAYADWTYPDDDEAHTVTVNVTLLDGTGMPYMVQPLNLEVCRETKLLLWVERFDTSKHLFHGRLLTKSGSVVSDKAVKAYLNGSLLDEDLTTNATGHFSFERNFNPGEGKVFYGLEVVFEGTENQTATLNGTDFMGNPFTVCRTTQFNYKPSSNMTNLLIEPQVSDTVVVTKTPEEIQQEAEDSGQLRMETRFSWLPPWFWLRTTIQILNPSMNIVTCTSPVGGWLEDGQGLENPLYEIFAGVPQESIEDIKSVTLSTITTATASFIGGFIAAKATEWNPLWYMAAMATYTAASLITLYAIRTFADAHTAKATLITAGWALLSLSTLGFTKTIPIYLSNIIGGDPVTAAVRSLAKTIISVSIITPILKTLGASIPGFLFYFLNFILGVLALTLGYQIT